MGFADFKAYLKKVNLKPKGVKEIVLEVSDGALAGKIDTLAEMIDGRVTVSIDSDVVRYNVQINARTEKPIKTYRVDESGVVSEITPEGEQLEMDLGLPKDKQQIVEVPEEIDRGVVDEFILELLAPSFEDLPYPFVDWVIRLHDGETYIKIANEYGISSGRIAELVEEYRARVAPLAQKWDEWRQSKGDPQPPASSEARDEDHEDGTGLTDAYEMSDEELSDGNEGDPDEDLNEDHTDDEDNPESSERELEEWEREVLRIQPTTEPADLDSFILSKKPSFPEIQFDFPALLERKRSGETWMQIASSLKVTSGVLSAAWNKYKKLAQEMRDNGAA